MSEEESASQVPEGAAVFPEIPAELGVSPLFLAVLHALVFLQGSEVSVVNTAAADEAAEYITGYLQRLEGRDLRRLREDISCILALAKEEKWPKGDIQFLKSFMADHGIGQVEAP